MCVIYLCSCVHLRVSERASIYQCVRPRAHFYVSLSCAYNYLFVPVVCVFYNCLSTTIISTKWSKPGTTRREKSSAHAENVFHSPIQTRVTGIKPHPAPQQVWQPLEALTLPYSQPQQISFREERKGTSLSPVAAHHGWVHLLSFTRHVNEQINVWIWINRSEQPTVWSTLNYKV